MVTVTAPGGGEACALSRKVLRRDPGAPGTPAPGTPGAHLANAVGGSEGRDVSD